MVAFSAELHSRMQVQLQDIALTTVNLLERAERSAAAVGALMQELKDFMAGYIFADPDEEVKFFKEIKPAFLKEMLYFLKLFAIESQKPIGGPEAVKNYYAGQLDIITAFFEQNKFLVLYLRSGKHHLDGLLFVRSPEGLPLYPEYNLDADGSFSNLYSYKLAKIQAYEELAAFLTIRITGGELEKPADSAAAGHPLVWTATKADFIELVYGLQTLGVFNNGKANVQQITDWLQQYFNVKVANVHGYFQSMRIRKINRTRFWDRGKESVTRRMDEADENPRFH